MKKLIFFSILFASINFYAQKDSTTKKQKHELGADITGLLGQFFNLNSSNTVQANIPNYYVTYRYHLKKSNIRFGIGGSYSKSSVSGYTVNGEDKVFYNAQTNFSVRLGYEFVSELSKRWQAFYGIDFRPTISNLNNPAQFSSGGYINGYLIKSSTLGFAPLLGFRFRINERVSITTEASFSYNIGNSSTQRTYLSQNNTLYPYIPNDKALKATNISAGFSQPVFLILTVKL